MILNTTGATCVIAGICKLVSGKLINEATTNPSNVPNNPNTKYVTDN